MYSEIRGLYALPNVPLQAVYDPPSSSKRRSLLLGRWAAISCTQRTLPQVRCLLHAQSIRISNTDTFIYCRPTPRPTFDSEIHARHLFFLSGRAPCPAAECRVERASRMASPGGVDHGARTKCHGRRERSAASSGSLRFTFDSLAVYTDAAGRCRVHLGTREPRAHDGTSTGASEGRNKGHS